MSDKPKEVIEELRQTIEKQAREINELRYPGNDPFPQHFGGCPAAPQSTKKDRCTCDDYAAKDPTSRFYRPPEPTDKQRIDALEWLVRDANTKRVWIAQGCVCVIGVGRQQLIEGNDVRDALDALSALQEDTADVR